MTISEILFYANEQCEDSVDHNTLLQYFNKGIGRINNECGLKLPKVTPLNASDSYNVSDYDWVNDMVADMLLAFVSGSIFQQAGYTNAENTFMLEYNGLRLQFNAKYKHMIDPEYILSYDENAQMRKGTVTNKIILSKRRGMW